MVKKIAYDMRRFEGAVFDFDDAVQVGAIALRKALNGFDPGNGAKFSTYAYQVIRFEIYRARQVGHSTIKLSTDAYCDLARALSKSVELHRPDRHGGAELFLHDQGREDVEKIDEEMSTQDVDLESRVALRQVLSHHSFWPRGELVLAERFVLGRTLDEIGLELGVTRERVRQIEARELRNLRWVLQ